MKRGEIRYYTFKLPDKRRPVLILTRSSVIGHIGEVTIAPLTSTVRGIPSEIALSPEDGVLTRCAINLDHVQTVCKDKIGRLICTLPRAKMLAVREALCFALGFDEDVV